MRLATILMTLLFNFSLCAQDVKISKTRIVAGIAIPEFLHLGASYRIANISQIGVSVGVSPSWGVTYTSLNVEHRLYFDKIGKKANQKTLFFRQGVSYFPAEQSSKNFSFNFTIGNDFIFKNSGNGITIDAGIIALLNHRSDYYRDGAIYVVWPALRFQFYFSL
ncbi:MAG: hypothetical protein ABJB16_08935 [Saprospiraceae bacterium]